MIVISSLDNDKVKKLRKLQMKKYRDRYNEYIVEGLHLVYEAYKIGVLDELILLEGENLPLPVPYTYYSKNVIKKVSVMDTPSTVMGLCHKREKDEIVGNRILILDDIQDPGNLGTIIRSAVAFNIDTIVLSNNTVDLYNSKVLRATQGMFFHTNIIIRNVFEIVALLRNINIPIYGTDVNGGVDARSLTEDDKKRFALIIGNEGNGVKKELNDLCDKKLYIKMRKDVESLNVAIAGSILLYELGM